MTENGRRKTTLRSKRPIYLVYEIVDSDGEKIEGAKLVSSLCTRDSNATLRAVTDNKSNYIQLDLS